MIAVASARPRAKSIALRQVSIPLSDNADHPRAPLGCGVGSETLSPLSALEKCLGIDADRITLSFRGRGSREELWLK